MSGQSKRPCDHGGLGAESTAAGLRTENYCSGPTAGMAGGRPITSFVSVAPPQHPGLILELSEWAHKGADAAEKVVTQVTKSAAARAFRKLEIVDKLPRPVSNAAGDLRGMVMSRRAKTIYNYAIKGAEEFEKYSKALVIAGIVLEITKEADRIRNISHSSLATGERGRQIALVVSTAVLRAFTSSVTSATHLVAKSIEGYLDLAGLVTASSTPQRWVEDLTELDAKIKSTHDRVMDPAFIDLHGQAAVGEFVNWIDVHVNLH